jgi:hypothetical protein
MRANTSTSSAGNQAGMALSRWITFLGFTACSLAFFGCAAAYNARNDMAPDNRHSVNCYIRGAFGRDYYRETPKKIVITIYSHGPNDKMLQEKDAQEQLPSGVNVSRPIPGLEMKVLLERQYRIKGSSVSWRAVWSPQNDFSIIFYDYGPNEQAPDSSKEAAAHERLLCTISYSFDSSTGEYKEASNVKP